MKYLYLDTSSNYLYTGIVDDEELLNERKIKLEKELSTKAFKNIVEMLEEKRLEPKDINKIILVNGPGSFTGCRIGITIAKTFAWCLSIPITVISSLEAMATVNKKYDFSVPVIDARRDFVFAGIYDRNNNQVLKNQYIKKSILEVAIKNISSDFTYITNDSIELNGNVMSYDPDILSIVSKYKYNENVNPHSIDANYLKLTEAEEKLNDREC